MRRFVLVSGMLVALSAMFAQTFGVITGHISDAGGAAIPAAKTFLTKIATNAIRETV